MTATQPKPGSTCMSCRARPATTTRVGSAGRAKHLCNTCASKQNVSEFSNQKRSTK